MKVLQLCNKPPFPPVDGGCVAMNAITSGLLANGHEVKVLAINTPKHSFQKEKIPAEYFQKTKIESVFINTNLSVLKALKNLFTKGSYNVERFYSKAFEEKLITLLKKDDFDVVHFESLFVAPYLEAVKKYSDGKTVLRAHNTEHLIWERLAMQSENLLKKRYLNFLAQRMKKYETEILNEFDGIAAITAQDRVIFMKNGCQKPIEVFPLGIDSAQYKPADENEVEYPSLFHLGSMDWQPNEEGIKWFLENVWLKINEQFPEMKLYLAGRNMPEWLRSLEMRNVLVEENVGNAHDFMRNKAVMIVPLLSGSGMRVKIIEGMALGKAIISTTVGAEGIDCKDGENILIADTPEKFVEQTTKSVNNKHFYNMICSNARKQAVEKYNYKRIAEELSNYYKSL